MGRQIWDETGCLLWSLYYIRGEYNACLHYLYSLDMLDPYFATLLCYTRTYQMEMTKVYVKPNGSMGKPGIFSLINTPKSHFTDRSDS